jgi:hypothetical protein
MARKRSPIIMVVPSKQVAFCVTRNYKPAWHLVCDSIF